MHTEESFIESKQNILENYAIHGKSIYIWGAGVLGKELLERVAKYHCVLAFIDSNLEKQQNGYEGKRVISFEEYLENTQKGIVVIAATASNTEAIKEQLLCHDKEENQDFYTVDCFLNDVFPVIAFYEYGDLYVSLSQISLTERCTLKCKKCAHGCYNVDRNSIDMSIEDIRKSADYFFHNIDFAGEFVLIGGEPLLYKQLKEAIAYIGNTYRNQIGIFSITTNGTILPMEELLQECQKYHVLFRISNYSKTLPRLEDKYIRLCEQLEKYNIPYVLGKPEANWVDYGFGSFVRNEHENLKEVFRNCNTPCREVRNNKFYYCVMARSISENLKINAGADDYLDLNEAHSNDKESILRFQLGYLEKGYLDMCRFCRGAEAQNYIIPAAEQVVI